MEAKFKHVSNLIEKDIASGIYDETQKLLTEDEFIIKYNVSRNTIRRAIDLLVKRGVALPVQGSGIYLRKKRLGQPINLENLRGLTYYLGDRNVSSVVLDFKLMPADKKIVELMHCELDTPTYYVHRLRKLDNKPYCIEYSYYNKDLIPYLDNEIINGSIYNYIRNDLKKTINFIDEVISATVLTKEEADLLGLKENEPAIICENTSMFKTGTIFNYCYSVFNYKETKFLKMTSTV